MKAYELTLRCYGENKDGLWSVVCVDLCLAAQASTVEEAREKLESQIHEYIHDALVGEDVKHADTLLRRRAPFSLLAKYYWIAMQSELQRRKELAKSILFTEHMPLKPC